MKRTRVVSLRLTEVEYASLARLAELRGVKVSDALRQIINTPSEYKFDYPHRTGTMTTTVGDVKYFVWNGGTTNV